MAYHNIRTPVFYCNMLEYLDRHGLIQHASGNSSERIYMNFQRWGIWATAGNTGDTRTVTSDVNITDWLGSKCFYAILGHNGDNAGAKVKVQYYKGNSYKTISSDLKVIVNGSITSGVNTFKYDLVLPDGRRIDVKTKRSTVVPKEHYDCTVTDFQIDYDCDGYIFVRVLRTYEKGWVLGYISKDDFKKNCIFKKRGERDGKYTYKHSCYNVRIDDLIVP